MMNLQNSTKGVVSSEKENSKKIETTQAKNPKSPQQKIAAGASRADV